MPTMPTVPAATNLSISPFSMPFQPLSIDQYLQFSQGIFDQQLQQREDLYANTFKAIEKYGDRWINQALSLDKEFMPQYSELYTSLLEQANPEFMPTYTALGKSVQEGLAAGYELGPALGREVEQAIRGAQTARGNWLGTAPTAQEAFGMGEAAINLYGLRVGQAQNFLNSKQPTDMWGALQSSSKYGIWDAAVPAAAQYPNPGIAPNVFGTIQAAQSAYNATSANAYGTYVSGLIGAGTLNNQSAFDRYNAQFDQFLYKTSVQQGLFSQPSVGGGGGAGMGAAIGGIASGVGAAASAAISAICWLARRAIPNDWKEFRKWLFTKAPRGIRKAYIFNARRIANSISDAEAMALGKVMRAILA